MLSYFIAQDDLEGSWRRALGSIVTVWRNWRSTVLLFKRYKSDFPGSSAYLWGNVLFVRKL